MKSFLINIKTKNYFTQNKSYLLFFIIIVCLIVPYLVFFISLNYNKLSVKKQIKKNIIAGIKKYDLVFLKFSQFEINNLLKWKHSKEFEYKHQLYDIVSFETKNDSTYYWCWLDNDETELNKKLNFLTLFALGNNPQNKENYRLITFFYHNLIFVDIFSLNTFMSKIKDITFLYIKNSFDYSISPIYPPPKNC